MPVTQQRAAMSAAEVVVTGRCMCPNCMRERPVEGGRTIIGTRGIKRWICASCYGIRKFNMKGAR